MASLRDIGFMLGYDLDKNSEKKVEDSVTKLKNTASKLLGAIGIGFSLSNINATIEEFRKVNRTITSTVKGLGDVAGAEKKILEAANSSRTTYEQMANTVSDLVKSGSDMFPVDEAIAFSSTVTQLMKTAGKGDSDITQMMQSLTKSMQNGTLQTDTLNTMLQKCPEAAQMLAKELGVDVQELQKLAAKGKISAQQLKDAFMNSSAKIRNDFNKMDMSISEAIQTVRNRWGFMLADFDKTFGFTDTIAQVIKKVADKAFDIMEKVKGKLLIVSNALGGTDNMLKLIAMSIGAVMLAVNGNKIISTISKVTGMLGKPNLKIMLIAGAIMLVMAIIQDLFAFMQGKDSLIGEMMTNAGADTDGFRDSLQSVFDSFNNDLMPAITEVGTALAGTLGTAIANILPLLMKIIIRITPIVSKLLLLATSILTPIIEGVGQIIDTILPPVTDLITSLMDALTPIIDAVIQFANELIQPVIDLVTELMTAVQPIIDAVTDFVNTLLQPIIDLITSLMDVLQPILDACTSLVDALIPVITPFIDGLKAALEPVSAALGVVSSALAPIIEALTKVVGWVASGLSWLVNLIFGGKNEAPEAPGATAVAASGYAKGTDNTEDTFIAGEEGPELITGAPGKKVFTALETGNILSAMALLGKAATVSPTSLPGASSSRTVNQYNEFVNTFNGDRAGQQKSSKAMNAASDDVISMMARALAVSR